MVAMLSNNAIRQPLSPIEELGGPAGAGKMMLSRALIAYHKEVDR